MPYQLHPQTGLIDYDRLEENAALFRPRLLVCGGSAYPRDYDYPRFRKIADKHGAYLLCDMAHFSGLVAAQECLSPFDYCDVVTSTTHKTLRGPRSGLIFYRRGFKKNAQGEPTQDKYDLEEKINFAVFPSTQGGPHQNVIAGVATALKQASTSEFKEYIQQVKKNASALAKFLMEKGYSVISNGTDNHLLLWDIRPQGLTGNKLEKLYERASISVNKNAVYGDTSALAPGGIRLGAPSLTSRGFKEKDIQQVVDFLDRGVKIALKIQETHGKQLLKDFVVSLKDNPQVEELKNEVEQFASQFPLPG